MPDEPPARTDWKLEALRLLRFAIAKFFGAFDKLPPVILAAALLVIVCRARSSDMVAIARAVVEALGEKIPSILGWIVAAMMVAFSVILVLVMRSIYQNEISRVANERDRLQEILNKQPVQHSDKI